MTMDQRRMKIIEEELRTPKTKETAILNLQKCGLLTKTGEVATPYKRIVVKKS